MTREQLIKHFVSVEFNRFLAYYKNAPDLNVKASDKEDRGGRRNKGRNEKGQRSRGDRNDFSRFFINIGSKDQVNASTLIGFINRKMRGQKFEIGKVDIMKKFSFFEIDKSIEKEVLKSFANSDFDGRELTVELSKPEPKRERGETESNPRKKRRKKRKS